MLTSWEWWQENMKCLCYLIKPFCFCKSRKLCRVFQKWLKNKNKSITMAWWIRLCQFSHSTQIVMVSWVKENWGWWPDFNSQWITAHVACPTCGYCHDIKSNIDFCKLLVSWHTYKLISVKYCCRFRLLKPIGYYTMFFFYFFWRMCEPFVCVHTCVHINIGGPVHVHM